MPIAGGASTVDSLKAMLQFDLGNPATQQIKSALTNIDFVNQALGGSSKKIEAYQTAGLAPYPTSDPGVGLRSVARLMAAKVSLPFAWVDHDNHAYFQLERSAFRTLGLRSTAIHVNGFTHSGYIWLSRRSENKFIDPGLLDNLAAGGIAADETPWVCAKRELWEEAGVPMAISEQINPVGRMHMCRPIAQLGFHDEQVYIYDLALPEQFVPTNHDGEVSGFIEISYSEAAARILADEFTVDAAFVTADFILRNYAA
jgi:8-oxo-dGTP pyrophosphatase MutT (NUDIX family)